MTRPNRREEKLAKLFSNLPNNAFPTAADMAVDYQPGVFSWDSKMVHFDFLGMGKPQRISVKREDVEVPKDSEGFFAEAYDFGPSAKNQNIGERTEFIGTAHSRHDTPLWKKRAWNTLNEWCTPSSFRMVVLERVMRFSAKAYARLILPEGVYYFLADEKQLGHHETERGELRVYTARFVRHVALSDDPHWRIAKLNDETRGHLDVAWDAYLDGHKPVFREVSYAQPEGVKKS